MYFNGHVIVIEWQCTEHPLKGLASGNFFNRFWFQMTEKKQLLRGILDFLDESVILPPGDWAKGNLLPISQMMEVRRRRAKNWKPGGVGGGERKNTNPGEGGEGNRRNPFERTQIPFGGLVEDVKQRHFRSYWSDIKDGLNAQCLAAIIFIFFACLSGAFV